MIEDLSCTLCACPLGREFKQFTELKEFQIGPAPDLKLLKLFKLFKPSKSLSKGFEEFKLFKELKEFKIGKCESVECEVR